MKRKLIAYILLAYLGVFSGCEYLNVVPDNIATLDNAFSNRSMAEKYLFTCYSYMPSHANLGSQVFLAGDEFWATYPQFPQHFYNEPFETIARGKQGVVNPCLNYWDGLNGAKPMFRALRDCNVFLERMKGEIPGLYDDEKQRWVAEVKFLKAYYHYWLLRMYGPIPLVKENLPISAGVDEVLVEREPVDMCFDYIVSLLDEATANLPMTLDKITTEMGRTTKPIALAVKAKVLVEAASPLFNGNTDYASFRRNKDGVAYFNQTFDIAKWEKAATACRNAIDTCHLAGFALFQYQPGINEKMVPETVTQMSIRNSVTEYNYTINNEVIWRNPNSRSSSLQYYTWPCLDQQFLGNNGLFGVRVKLALPMRIAEMFYTSNGVPIDEDQEWELNGQYAGRYDVTTANEEDKYHIKEGFQTAKLNFDREVRFYANLAFDGGLFYGVGKYDSDDQWLIQAKQEGPAWPITGYFCKKLIHTNNVINGTSSFSTIDYPWPVIRLADLYLLCSEALNEAYGPTEDAYQWIDLVRNRAGLDGVVESWSKNAKASYKSKPTTKDGLREIIQHERLIELANEGHRYWEIRRWKRAIELWNNQPIQGWDGEQKETAPYYRVRTLFTQQFTTKNYLWPIREYNLSVNNNLDQNPGW